MLLATRKTKNNLVRTVLASSVLICSICHINIAHAAFVNIGADKTSANADGGATLGDNSVNFTADNKLEMLDGFLNATGDAELKADAGVSVKTTVANQGTVIFQGAIKVLGDIGIDNARRVKALQFENGTGTLVDIVGAVESSGLTFSGGGAVNFQGNQGAATASTITATGNGSVEFAGTAKFATGAVFGTTAGDSFTATFNAGTTFVGTLNVEKNTTVNLDIATANAGGIFTVKDTATLNFTKDYNLAANNLIVLGTGGGANATVNITAARTLTTTGDTIVTDGTFTVGAGGTLDTDDLEFHGGSIANLQLGTAGGAAEVDGTSVVNFNNNYTITGTLTTANTGTINVLAGKTLQVDDDITMGGSSVLNATGGTIDNDAAGGRNFALSGSAIANLGTGDVDGSMNVAGNSTVNFLGGQFNIATGDLVFAANGSASVLSGSKANVANDITTVAGTQLTFDLNNTITPGTFVAGNNADLDVDRIINVSNVDVSLVPANTTVTKNLVTAAGGMAPGNAPILNAPNNIFVNYTLTQTATKVNLNINRTTPTGLDGSISGIAGIIAGLDSTNAPGELGVLVDNLLDITNPDVLQDELAEIAPQGINGGIVDSVVGITNETFDLFSQRIGELRAGLDSYNTGYAAGHMTESGHGTWVKVFGNHADQSRRGNIAGYTGETWGLAGGADIMITERHLVGVSLAWASTDVNFDAQRGGSDINSYQGAFYGSWNVTTPLYVNWMASAAYNKYKETQIISTGGFNQTALGEFDGWQYGARVETGYIFGEECFHITPTADLTYTHVSFDSFQQKGNSTANQVIDYGSVSALLAGVGVKFSYDYEMEKALLQPEAHANITYDIIGDEMDANSRFVGFGTSYNVQGASVKRTDYNVGLSLTTYGHSGLGFSISYDYDWKSSYHAHSGFARIRYEW